MDSIQIDTSSEAKLISTAQGAVSQCNWVVGRCASEWTKKYAKGRTDADFASQVGLSADQVFQRRRVWESFGDVYQNYSGLKWSHFYVVVNWDDSAECLQWAEENESTVAEMKAWRRAQRGEDLTTEAPLDEWGGDPSITFVSQEPVAVRDPGGLYGDGEGPGTARLVDEGAETMSAAARESDAAAAGYAPFRQGAGSPAPKDNGGATAVAERPQPSAEQLLKRMTNTIVKYNKSLNSSLIRELQKMPLDDREKLISAVAEFSSKMASLQ